MARFLGVAVQTDILVTVPVGTAPARVAFFRPDDLIACVATLSPTEPESITVAIPRDHASAAEIVLGRVVRVCFEGGTDDTEWDIALLDDTSGDNVLMITALPIAMRLARIIYMGTTAASGAAEPEWTGVQLTATEWLNTLVIPQCAAAGMAFTLGVVDNTTSRFTMDGDWSSLLEIVNAIAEPGRATGEFQLRRDGAASYGYKIDMIDTIGGSAATVRVRTAVNLIETKRQRSLVEVATRLHPRGSSDSVATRTMSEHVWSIKSVVNGTTLELEDPFGGAAPIAYDDQLNGLYLAVLNSPTFATTVVTDSAVATQYVTIGSTAGMTAGNWCRFQIGAGETGARLTSLTVPLLADHSADGGYGDRAQVLDRPAINADTNLIDNAMLRAWTVAADPPDGWEEFGANAALVTFSQELADGPATGISSFRAVVGADDLFGAYTGVAQGRALQIRSPLCYPWESATAGRRMYVATAWVKVVAANAETVAVTFEANGTYLAAFPVGTFSPGDDLGTWVRYESPATDYALGMEAVGHRVVVDVSTTDTPDLTDPVGVWQGLWSVATTYAANDYVSYSGEVYRCSSAPSTANTPPGTDWTLVSPTPAIRAEAGFTMLVSAVTFAEAPTAIADREGSGGTELWQAANAALPLRSSPIRGYDLSVADLAADDPTTYASLAFVSGGTVEVADTDLGVTTPLRLVEYRPDYLRPLASMIRVGQPADLLTALAESGRLVTTLGT